ncbi:uncharacterized protein LOC126418439 [Schistocerca serialis cubense]|uniref:uncharacterized protein LOC126418439 n=1 Tax=Schistocerca serialis cubense TaxID=2023355 RepID=UPI00214E4B00|nr:uncharacterized protein LOC126418439 [Schistocerca serialis cubense]
MASNTVLCALLVALLAALCSGEADVSSRQKRPLSDQRLAEYQTLLALKAMGHTIPVPDPMKVGRKRSFSSDVWRLMNEADMPVEEYVPMPGDSSVRRYLLPLQV